MKIPIETKPALWGAVAGAIAVAVVGSDQVSAIAKACANLLIAA